MVVWLYTRVSNQKPITIHESKMSLIIIKNSISIKYELNLELIYGANEASFRLYLNILVKIIFQKLIFRSLLLNQLMEKLSNEDNKKLKCTWRRIIFVLIREKVSLMFLYFFLMLCHSVHVQICTYKFYFIFEIMSC